MTRATSWLRAVRFVATAIGAGIGTLSLFLTAQTFGPPGVYSKDFGQEYLLTRAIGAGADPYVPIRDLALRFATPTGYLDKPHPTPHPPTLGLLVLPLGLVSYETAAVAWFVFELFCIVLAVRLIAVSGSLPIRARAVPIASLVMLSWPPLILDVGLGQLTTPILAALAGAFAALVRSSRLVAGGLVGLTLLIKPLAWPWLVVFGATGNWRSAAAATAVAVGGYAIGALVIGVDRMWHYFAVVLPEISASMGTEPTNISLWVLLPRALGIASPLVGLLAPALVTLALAVWMLRARPPTRAAGAVATALSVVLSPIAWHFYLVIAALPMAYVLALLAKRGFRGLEVAATIGVGVLLFLSYDHWLWLGAFARQNLVLFGPTIGVLLLSLLVVWLSPADRLLDDPAKPVQASLS